MPSSDLITQLLHNQQSCFLATIDNNALPHASYAPYAINLPNNEIYVFLSELSKHCRNLLDQPQASLLIVEDESQSQQIFARKRVQYQATANVIEKDCEKQAILESLKQRHGDIIDLLASLPDFKAFVFRPIHGRYIEGFGKAFSNENGTLTEGFKHITNAS